MMHPVQMLILFLLIIDLICMFFLFIKKLIFKKQLDVTKYPIFISLKLFTLVLSILFMYMFTMNLDWENWLYMEVKSTVIIVLIIYYLIITTEFLTKYRFYLMVFVGLGCLVHSGYYWVQNFYLPNDLETYRMSPEANYIINMIAYGLLFIAGTVGLILKLRKK